ncbi:MAG: NAD-binding protein [Candidatus Sumerlaeota bacterium]|nr:NAD-binding protein [Candidatus Sumerlaeota bacterium]
MADPPERPATAPRLSTGRKLLMAVGLLLTVVAVGVYGFKTLVPDYTWIEALYMTVITLSTVGYKEVHAQTPVSMVFTCALIAGGVASISLVLSLTAGVVIEDVLSKEVGRRRMEKRIADLRDHFILCGFGRLGSAVAAIFRREKTPFVVVEKDPAVVEEVLRQGDLVHAGDAASDEVLLAVGMERARCLLALTSGDAENLYITLSARQMNPKINIIARADDEHAASKLRRAGANRVVNPYVMGATSLAHAALRPTVIDFFEAMTGGAEAYGFRIEELAVGRDSEVAGRTIGSLNLSQRVGVIVIGIMRQDGQLTFNPSGKSELNPGDILIAVGTDRQLLDMRVMLAPR